MGRQRGHRDLADLTAREREVFDLVRDGLTNPQIADRLDLSLETVKHHVSEILSKLGVSSREEAVSRMPREVRGWWQAVPRWALVGAAGIAVAALGVLAWGVIQEGGSEESAGEVDNAAGSSTPGSQPPPSTVEQGFARLGEAISRPGQVFHTRMTVSDLPPMTIDLWIDPEREVARQELRLGSEDGLVADKTFVIVGDSVYYGEGGQFQQSIQGCPGVQDALLSLIPDCHRVQPFDEPFAFLVEPEAEYQGVPAVVLVVQSVPPTPEPSPLLTGSHPNIPSPALAGSFPSIHNWFYLERDTFLPLAKIAGPSADGQPEDGALVSTYENAFISVDSLPGDFFDPASLGPIPTPR